MSEVTNMGIITRELKDEEDTNDPNSISTREIPEGVEVFEINGPFFFGAASKFKDAMREVEKPPKIRIVRMRNVNVIDATGLHTFREFLGESKRDGTYIILSGVHAQPIFAFEQSGLIKIIGDENMFGNIDDALDKAREVLNLPIKGRPEEFIPSVSREIK
jgi:SulP family sulfate permease